MNGVQHKVFSLMAASAYCIFTGDISNVSAFITAPIGAATPDLDHPAKKENKAIRTGIKTVNSTVNSIAVIGGAALGGAFLLPMLFPKQMAKYAGITGNIQTIGLRYLIWIIAIAGFVVLKEILARSKTFKWSVSHRGLTHTLIPIGILMYGRIALLSGNSILTNLLDGYMVGFASHLFIDSFNKGKCPIAFPLTTQGIGFPISIPTKNVKACWACIVIVGVLLNVGAYWFKFMR